MMRIKSIGFSTLSGICLIGLTACLESQAAPVFLSLTQNEFTIEVLSSELETPWSVAELPSGDFLITERDGALKRLSGGMLTDIDGLPDDIYAESQAGLFDIVLGSDFAQNGTVYFSYARGKKSANGTTVVKAVLDNNSLKDKQHIFKAAPLKIGGGHFGGRLAVMENGDVIVTTGDGFRYREASQDTESDLGKVIRITENGSEHISIGHRNVQGLIFDKESGNLWAHEHGARGGDELNLIKQSLNYGWPLVTKGVDYNGAKITPFTEMEGMEEPIHYWVPSIAPSGLTIYRGDMFKEWNGDALVGGLASGDVRRVDLENGKSIGETIILSDLGERVRDIRTASDGAILVLIDDPIEGKLLRVTPK
ncbi:MAG: PQQ-dependent sugar dehydrogenase [Maricaulaceae bacterium]